MLRIPRKKFSISKFIILLMAYVDRVGTLSLDKLNIMAIVSSTLYKTLNYTYISH